MAVSESLGNFLSAFDRPEIKQLLIFISLYALFPLNRQIRNEFRIKKEFLMFSPNNKTIKNPRVLIKSRCKYDKQVPRTVIYCFPFIKKKLIMQ